MPYLNECPEIQEFVVIEIKRVKSNKGYLIIGENTTAFLWNNDKVLKQLLVALASWVDIGIGCELIVKRQNEKGDFIVEKNLIKKQPVPCKWVFTELGYKLEGVNEGEESNPFL